MKKLSFIFAVLLSMQAVCGQAAPDNYDKQWAVMPLATKAGPDTAPGAADSDGLATKGEGFQYVFAVTYAPSAPQRAYLGVDTSGVWRSDDGGNNWYPVFFGFDANGAVSVVVDPVNPDIVLAAGFYGFERKRSVAYPNRIQGIYRSTTGGKNWEKVYNTGFYRRYGKGVLFVFVPGEQKGNLTPLVYAASSDDGLLRSFDNGLTWEKTTIRTSDGNTIGEIHDTKMVPGGTALKHSLIAVTEKGIFIITNGEARKIGNGLPSISGLSPEAREKLGPMTVAVSPSDKNLVLVAYGNAGIWRSGDGGETFIPSVFSGAAKLQGAAMTPCITDVALSPVDSRIAYARAHLVGMKPLYSHDSGKSWQFAADANLDKLMPREGFYFSSPFAPHPDDALTALHISNGRERVLKTQDGGVAWRYSGRGYSGAALNSMCFISDTEFYVGLVDYGLWHTKDGGSSFSEILLGRIFGSQTVGAFDVKVNADGLHTILLSLGQWSNRGIAISTNSGKTWNYNDKISTGKGVAFIHPDIQGLYIIGENISSDGGITWNKLGTQYTGNLICYYVDNENSHTLYAIGEYNKKAVIYKSVDIAQTWTQVGDALHIPRNDIKDLSFSPKGIYLATTGGIYYSPGKSTSDSWIKFKNFPSDAHGSQFTTSLAINHKNSDEIWVSCRNPGTGKGQGLIASFDGGSTWEQQDNTNVPLFTITKVIISPFSNTVYAGTYYGIYRFMRK